MLVCIPPELQSRLGTILPQIPGRAIQLAPCPYLARLDLFSRASYGEKGTTRAGCAIDEQGRSPGRLSFSLQLLLCAVDGPMRHGPFGPGNA